MYYRNKAYTCHIDYNSTEDAFNQLYVWPYLDVVSKSFTIEGINSDFVQGQPCLESMIRQLKAVNLYVDDKNQYKADGLIKLFGLNDLELLLLETSGCFNNKDKKNCNLITTRVFMVHWQCLNALSMTTHMHLWNHLQR